MIKDFKNFTKRTRLANGQTQWQKKYDDGETAWLCINGSGITRKKVIDAFTNQELENSEEEHEDQINYWNS